MPPSVVTVTSAVPTPGGDVAVIWVSLSSVKDARLLPNLTAGFTPHPKSVPVIVTLVPPEVEPLADEIEVIVGTLQNAKTSEVVPRIK